MKRLALLLLLLPTLAWAGKGVSGISVIKQRSLTSVGITAFVSGDDDSNAVLRIFQRWSGVGASFDTGMVMVRGNHGPRRTTLTDPTALASGEAYDARILNLWPGRTVDYYIEVMDNGGGSGNWSFDTTSCARIPVIGDSAGYVGPLVYVDQRGNIPGSVRTIQAGVTALLAKPAEGRNGAVIVYPGEYHERIDLDAGTDGYRRFIIGVSPDKDAQIVCGENEEVATGNYAVGGPIVWTKTNFPAMANHAANDSIYKAYYPSGGGPGDSTGLIILGDREQLHFKPSLLALQADSTAVGVLIPDYGEASGWWWQNDTLYLKRRSGLSPAGSVLHAGYRNSLMVVKRRNWIIKKLTFRYAGGVTGLALTDRAHWAQGINPGGDGAGIRAGLLHDGGGLVVDSCYFYGLNAPAVWVQHGGGGSHGPSSNLYTCDSAIVANCNIDGLSVGGMLYGAGKLHMEENACQIVLEGSGYNVYKNTVANPFNCIQIGAGVTSNTDTSTTARAEIYGNIISNTPDDGFELDGSHAINVLVMNNTATATSSGVSLAPCFSGPIFFIGNKFVKWTSFGVKAGGNETAVTRFWHNTITSSTSGKSAVDASTGGQCTGLWFENNILGGSGGNYSYVFAPGTGGSPLDSTAFISQNNLNWNRLDAATSPGSYPLQTIKTFAQVRAWGWEKNGVQSTGVFMDSTNYNYNLVRPLPGRRITGVNTGLDGKLWDDTGGRAPDCGAIQRPFP